MPDPVLALISRRVVTREGIRPAVVVAEGGRIVDVADVAGAPGDAVDVGDLAVLPGLVDTHVRVNEPARTSSEGFDSATRAAAAGGVTTIVAMPVGSSPATTTLEALDRKRAAAEGRVHVDVAFWGGAVPGAEAHLPALHDAGVLGFEAFLCDSGVPEFGCFAPAELEGLLARTAAVDALLLVHAEDPDVVARATRAVLAGGADPRSHETWLTGRPPAAEETAADAAIRAVRRTGGRLHVLSLSAASAGDRLARARAEGLPLTVETCPHHLALAAEDIPPGATAFKSAPPIRRRGNAEMLWAALAGGRIDAVVSAHSPCPPGDRHPDTGDFLSAWSGIASLQVGLPVVWTAAAARGHDLDDVAAWMAAGPARIAGLPHKGAIAVGADADLVVFDPDARWTVEGAALHHRHPETPYEGMQLSGAVRTTYLRGREVARDGTVPGPPAGRLLRRGQG